jgi:hypothetical protein
MAMQFLGAGAKLSVMAKARTVSVRPGMHVALGVVLASVAFSGCSEVIALNSDRYLPELDAAALVSYRGSALVMRGFENADDNTTIFYYPKSGPRMYGGPVLASYFWYCFRTAFERIGVRVYDDGQAAPGIPVMDFRLIRLDEGAYTADVRVLGPAAQPALHKRYSVGGAPLASLDGRTLEARAYNMTTALFMSIVGDPEFQAAVTAGSPSRAVVVGPRTSRTGAGGPSFASTRLGSPE